MDLFNESNGRMTGEATVDYFVNCNVPERVMKVCRHLPKVVILLRDPVSRFVSNFHMRLALRGKGPYQAINETHTISRTINKEVRKFKSGLKRNKVSVKSIRKDWTKMRCLFREAKNLVHEGVYYVHMMNWICSYPRDKILVLNSEQFFDTPGEVMRTVFDFLGLRELSLSELQNTTAVVHNKGRYSSAARHKLGTFERNKLSQLYHLFNRALFELLDWDAVQWT